MARVSKKKPPSSPSSPPIAPLIVPPNPTLKPIYVPKRNRKPGESRFTSEAELREKVAHHGDGDVLSTGGLSQGHGRYTVNLRSTEGSSGGLGEGEERIREGAESFSRRLGLSW